MLKDEFYILSFKLRGTLHYLHTVLKDIPERNALQLVFKANLSPNERSMYLCRTVCMTKADNII